MNCATPERMAELAAISAQNRIAAREIKDEKFSAWLDRDFQRYKLQESRTSLKFCASCRIYVYCQPDEDPADAHHCLATHPYVAPDPDASDPTPAPVARTRRRKIVVREEKPVSGPEDQPSPGPAPRATRTRKERTPRVERPRKERVKKERPEPDRRPAQAVEF